MAEGHDALYVEGLSKTFGDQRVLDDVAITVKSGEVHALIGQNGAGKSTLIKILAGFHQADPGSTARVGGVSVDLSSSGSRDEHAMRFVHQDLALIGSLSARENLRLLDGGLSPIRSRQERDEVDVLLKEFELDVDIDRPVMMLRPAERAIIALARALGSDWSELDLLVLDEPTATLGRREIDQLFSYVRRVTERGVGVIYVSHLLDEILEIADRVTALRDGKVVATREVAEETETSLVEMMLGRAVDHSAPPAELVHTDSPAFVVENLRGEECDDISFTVQSGEIVGLGGLLGSGYDALPSLLAGAERWEEGRVQIDGKWHTSMDPTKAIRCGLGYIPADRRSLGLIEGFSLTENLTLPQPVVRGMGRLASASTEREEVMKWLERTEVVPAEPDRHVELLSGGNQQKLMVAKWLRLDPVVLIINQLSEGVDVGAKAALERLVAEAASQGCAVIVASADPEELVRLCHRVLVTRNGCVAAELTGAELSPERILVEHYEQAPKGEAA